MNKTIVVSEGCISAYVKDLSMGLSRIFTYAEDPLAISQLTVVLPDPAFLKALTALDDTHPAVATVMESLGIGIRLHLRVHRQLLAMLSVESLANLPVQVSDHKGIPVVSCVSSMINYSDVALLQWCWLLTPETCRVTDLARDHMQKHHIYFVNKRSLHVPGKSHRFNRRYSEDPFFTGKKTVDP
ncbi:PduM family microcompartment protein [Endozoicomonas sp. SESOKO1]|uniref:PduM family microcompartment protein n=1 Tax=Endozoicomonas sp. SESOKO1 TaxID=2828742 RepID=UPI00214746EB|nr:PduM family microcompartment protein [Endozoicomonas sp. SESOKO1]